MDERSPAGGDPPQDGSRGTVGIVGVGIMGLAYARNLISAGYAVVGFDPAEDRIRELVEAGGRAVASPQHVAAEAKVVLVALATPEALEDACLGDAGIAAGVGAGTIVVEMGTLPLPVKEACREAVEASGAAMLDCPVSGTGGQARDRDLVLYASGDERIVDKARPVLDAIARETRFVGPFGAGIKLKYIANLLVSVHNLAAAEALLLAEKAGLDLELVYDAISAGAGTSRMFEVRGPMMVRGEYEPATAKFDVHMKDVSLIMDFARACRSPAPLMAASVPYYAAALAQGRGDQDTAGLFAVLRQMSEQGARGGQGET